MPPNAPGEGRRQQQAWADGEAGRRCSQTEPNPTKAGRSLQCCASGTRGLPPDTRFWSVIGWSALKGEGALQLRQFQEGPDSARFLSAERLVPGQRPSSWRELRMSPRKLRCFFPNRVVTQLISPENQSSIRTERFVFK